MLMFQVIEANNGRLKTEICYTVELAQVLPSYLMPKCPILFTKRPADFKFYEIKDVLTDSLFNSPYTNKLYGSPY